MSIRDPNSRPFVVQIRVHSRSPFAVSIELAGRSRIGQRFGLALWPVRSEDDQLHQKKITHGSARYGEQLRNENVRSEGGEAEMDYCNGDDPVGKNDAAVLHELFCVVAAPATKDPELVQ